MVEIFVHPAGQDDNLGDSALRAGLITALRGRRRHLHVLLENQTTDYIAGIRLEDGDAVYSSRAQWLRSCLAATYPVFVLNAGEINPRAHDLYPHASQAGELAHISRVGGKVIAAGLGLKDPGVASSVTFAPGIIDAGVMSWRDRGSHGAAGFGGFAPDWAFLLGTSPSEWTPRDEREFIAVTLRFDVPLPDASWVSTVRDLARRTNTRIITFAQVARDAPRAVELAMLLGGEYSAACSTRHDDMDQHVRAIFRRSLAVVTDRAHGLIIAATEGCYPVGSALNPQKITRLLSTAGVGELTGDHDTLRARADMLEQALPSLGPAMVQARNDLARLRSRMDDVIDLSDAQGIP